MLLCIKFAHKLHIEPPTQTLGGNMFSWFGIDDAMITSGIMLVIYAIVGGGSDQ
jgi:hypothetical protein